MKRNEGSTILRCCVLHDHPEICWSTKSSFALSCWNMDKGASAIIRCPSHPDLESKIKCLLTVRRVFPFFCLLPIYSRNLLCLICIAVFLHKVLSMVPPTPVYSAWFFGGTYLQLWDTDPCTHCHLVANSLHLSLFLLGPKDMEFSYSSEWHIQNTTS